MVLPDDATSEQGHPRPDAAAQEAEPIRLRRGDGRQRSMSLLTKVSVAALCLVVLGVGFAFGPGRGLFERPYCAFAPGSARATSDAVVVEGGPNYPPDGEIYYTTVSVRSLTLWDEFRARRDPHTQVVSEDVGFCNNTEFEVRNRLQMDTSKDLASRVAFESLGFELEPIGVQVILVELQGASAGVLNLGEVITAVDGHTVTNFDDLSAALDGATMGQTVAITVRRSLDDESSDVRMVTLAPYPCTLEQQVGECDPNRPALGINVFGAVEYPFDIDIDSGKVGGPSAGLAFALAVVEKLTEGELTGGRKVAVTGTINSDGEVGPVGGILQKAEAARREGAEVFIVPPSEFEAALNAADDSIRVEVAATVDEALDVLEEIGGDPVETDSV